MPKNLPAIVPVRLKKNLPALKEADHVSAPILPNPQPLVRPHPGPSLPRIPFPGMIIERRPLAQAMRFASRIATRPSIPALACCLFAKDSVVVTDLDMSLRVRVDGVQELGVLVPVQGLARCLASVKRPEVEIGILPPMDGRPPSVSVDGAVLAGHDPGEFPAPKNLFPTGEVLAQASWGSLEAVLAAASIDDERKAFCGIFFELCKNVAVATDGHRLHSVKIQSTDDGDFLVSRKAIELLENIRRATRTPEVKANFFEHVAVLHVANFEVAARYETEKFPAWEEVIPGKPKYELRVSTQKLLDVLDQTAAAMGERYRGVRLRRVKDGLEIQGKNPDAGELTTRMPAQGWEEGESVGLNLSYLHDAVRFAPSDEVTIGITDSVQAIKIEDGPYMAVVMPLRLEEEKKNDIRKKR